MDIVIPFVVSPDEHLRLALRSLCKNARFDFNVWLVGHAPEWYKGNKILVDRFPERARDVNQKLILAMKEDGIGEDFIYSYDDIYFIQPVEISDIKVVAKEKVDRSSRIGGTGTRLWKAKLQETLECLKFDPVWNYESHLPRMLNKLKLAEIFSMYNLENRNLLFSTLYYNEFHKEPEAVLNTEPLIKLGLYETRTHDEILKMSTGQKFLNHDDTGYTKGCKKFLADMFPEKCKFET